MYIFWYLQGINYFVTHKTRTQNINVSERGAPRLQNFFLPFFKEISSKLMIFSKKFRPPPPTYWGLRAGLKKNPEKSGPLLKFFPAEFFSAEIIKNVEIFSGENFVFPFFWFMEILIFCLILNIPKFILKILKLYIFQANHSQFSQILCLYLSITGTELGWNSWGGG